MSAELTRALTDLATRFDTASWVEPIDTANHRVALERALKDGTEYEPVFRYDRSDVPAYLAAVENLRTEADDDLRPLLREAVTGDLTGRVERARALLARDDDSYSAATADLDGLPLPDLIARAEQILASSDGPDERAGVEAGEHSAEDAAAAMKAALGRLGLKDWTVEISSAMSARMSVNGPRRRLRVRSGSAFHRAEVRRLLVHEVGGHAWRWHRAGQQHEPLAVIPLGRTVLTEEGLALWGEHQHGFLDPATLRLYAARVLAVDVAREHGLMGVARAMAPHVGIENAAQMAMRVKRGLLEPSGPGGSTKDWSYLGGLEMCRAVSDERPGDLDLARSVKWGLELMPAMRELEVRGGIVPTKRITIDELVDDSP